MGCRRRITDHLSNFWQCNGRMDFRLTASYPINADSLLAA
jgi:hypothetical protein